jgi:hypothetical protein
MIVVPLLALLLAWPLIVHASVRAVGPTSWGEASEAATAAQRRAGRWKDSLGLRLVQVLSSPENDGFAETVAVFERSEPISLATMQDETMAVEELSRAVANVVGSDSPKASGLRQTAGGASVVWGRWVVDDLAYECVLAPSGDTSSVVVIAVPTTELEKHRDMIDGVIANLEGVSEPMPEFSLLGWRLGSVFLWMSLALGLHALMLRFVDQDNDHATAGRRAALINLGLVAIGTVIAYSILVPRELAIVHSGSNVMAMAVWIFVAGIVVVGAHFLISSRFERGLVQSAPASGAFASGIYSRTDMIRASRSDVQPLPPELAELSSGVHGTFDSAAPSPDYNEVPTGPIDLDRRNV